MEVNPQREEIKKATGPTGNLYILAFDHRGSFQKKMLGISGSPTPEGLAVEGRM